MPKWWKSLWGAVSGIANLATALTWVGVTTLAVALGALLLFWKWVVSCVQLHPIISAAGIGITAGAVVVLLIFLIRSRIVSPAQHQSRIQIAREAARSCIQNIDMMPAKFWADDDIVIDRLNDCWAAERKLRMVGVRLFMWPKPVSNQDTLKQYRIKLHAIRQLITKDLLDDAKGMSAEWEAEARERAKAVPTGSQQFIKNYF